MPGKASEMNEAEIRRQAQESYRRTLHEELETRSARNPGYSLRAFARDLGIRHSRLSEVLMAQPK
jgi:hypothetical protein